MAINVKIGAFAFNIAFCKCQSKNIIFFFHKFFFRHIIILKNIVIFRSILKCKFILRKIMA